MAITPEQALGSKREIEAAKIDELEAQCDEELKRKWENRGSVYIELEGSQFVINEVQKRFQASGWDVKYFNNRDGAGLTFSTKEQKGESYYDQ